MGEDLSYHLPATNVSGEDVLADAIQKIRLGKRQDAHQLAIEATRRLPGDQRAWLVRAEVAPSPEERLFCLSQANTIDPNNPDALERMYKALRELLELDPYLAYVDETGDLYRIRNSAFLSLAVPKYRKQPEQAPQLDPEVHNAFNLLRLAAVGLVLVGLGGFVLAPFAAIKALQARRRPLAKGDSVRSVIIFILSSLVWLVSLPLSAIFILHFLS